jgi:hypothetical protein
MANDLTSGTEQQDPGTGPVTARNYNKRAAAFIARLPKDQKGSLPTIGLGQPEFAAWRQYFERHLEWMPWAMRAVLGSQIQAMTVPAVWPVWFDGEFVEDRRWRPRAELPRLASDGPRPSLDDLRRRFGPNWGLRPATAPKRQRGQWTAPTDAELMAHYNGIPLPDDEARNDAA